jgi:hypothetical protein
VVALSVQGNLVDLVALRHREGRRAPAGYLGYNESKPSSLESLITSPSKANVCCRALTRGTGAQIRAIAASIARTGPFNEVHRHPPQHSDQPLCVVAVRRGPPFQPSGR